MEFVGLSSCDAVGVGRGVGQICLVPEPLLLLLLLKGYKGLLVLVETYVSDLVAAPILSARVMVVAAVEAVVVEAIVVVVKFMVAAWVWVGLGGGASSMEVARDEVKELSCKDHRLMSGYLALLASVNNDGSYRPLLTLLPVVMPPPPPRLSSSPPCFTTCDDGNEDDDRPLTPLGVPSDDEGCGGMVWSLVGCAGGDGLVISGDEVGPGKKISSKSSSKR